MIIESEQQQKISTSVVFKQKLVGLKVVDGVTRADLAQANCSFQTANVGLKSGAITHTGNMAIDFTKLSPELQAKIPEVQEWIVSVFEEMCNANAIVEEVETEEQTA